MLIEDNGKVNASFRGDNRLDYKEFGVFLCDPRTSSRAIIM